MKDFEITISLKGNELLIIEEHTTGAKSFVENEGNNWYISKYSTKEKALKVLDMIQKCICDYQLGEIFQMPRDEEVEEWK